MAALSGSIPTWHISAAANRAKKVNADARLLRSVGRIADGLPGGRMIGKAVVDTEGVEVGYVAGEDAQFLRIAEGPVGSLFLGRRFIDRIEDRVVLKGAIEDLFRGLNVVDASGEFVGIVRDTVETEDTMDSLIVEDEEGETVVVVLEDIKMIDEFIELDVTADELYANAG